MYLYIRNHFVLVMTSCGSSTSENGTYFVNSGYPSTYDGTGSCELTVIKAHPDVCQIRQNFNVINEMHKTIYVSRPVVARGTSVWLLTRQVVGLIPARENEVFNIFITYSGNEARRDIKYCCSTRNASKIRQ